MRALVRRHRVLFALLLVATAALALQTARTVARHLAPKTPGALSALVPQGALLSIESPDFAALLATWNHSTEQKAWLASSNDSVFSNSRLFGRLSDAETQFAAASGVPAARLLPQVAGKQSVFAWYDVGNLEFLYITRMPAAQAAQTDLLKSRGRWKQRQAGALSFYVRTSGNGGDTPKRTVAFASTGGLFLLATREDLLANALFLLQKPSASASLAGEPWFTESNAALPPEAAPPVLHMVLNLDRIVPLPQFRTYWVQANVTEMKQYRASVADLYREPTRFREERALLLKPVEAPSSPDPDLAALAAFAPADGVFRTTASADPGDAVTAIGEKIMGSPATTAVSAIDAPDPSLSTPQTGSASDLETRIDVPPPATAKTSNQALSDMLKTAGMDSFLTYSEADLPATAAGLWVPIRSAVVVHATASNGAATWNPQTVAQVLQRSLRGSLTAANLGIEFRANGPLYELTGPRPLVFAISGPFLLLADDPALLTAMLTPHPGVTAMPATLLTGFNHTAQRPPYKRLVGLIDGPSDAAAHDAPPFFSGNIRSLSDAFASLQSERLIAHHEVSQGAPILRQTVTYTWRSP